MDKDIHLDQAHKWFTVHMQHSVQQSPNPTPSPPTQRTTERGWFRTLNDIVWGNCLSWALRKNITLCLLFFPSGRLHARQTFKRIHVCKFTLVVMPTEQNIPHDKQNSKPSSKQTDLCSHEATAGEKKNWWKFSIYMPLRWLLIPFSQTRLIFLKKINSADWFAFVIT